MFTAVSTPFISGSVSGEDASTSRILQSGQVAETMSRSRLISMAQPGSAAGIGEVAPFWFTFLKQPFAVVPVGSAAANRARLRIRFNGAGDLAGFIRKPFQVTPVTTRRHIWCPPVQPPRAGGVTEFGRPKCDYLYQ